jgi:hypothetical protein
LSAFRRYGCDVRMPATLNDTWGQSTRLSFDERCL